MHLSLTGSVICFVYGWMFGEYGNSKGWGLLKTLAYSAPGAILIGIGCAALQLP